MSTLTHRRVDPAADAELLHRWVTEDRARFWGMTENTLDEVVEIYSYIDEQAHLAAYLLELDGTAVALMQSYDPWVDEIGEFYARLPGDVGVHFFMAPDRKLHTGQVVRYFLSFLFQNPAHARIVAEPDARNARAVGLVTRLGFELGPEVQLPHKPARFAFLTRAAYDARTLALQS